jgi:2-polyprenyl-6-methoxyphenol hydroxylase-like FAD-dependent oxidoreductase
MTQSRPDILIFGGGIAGAGLATALARAGRSVTVVERAPRFIDRIRGEFVHVWGVRELDRAGLLDVALDRAGGRLLPYWTKYTDAAPGPPYRWADDFPYTLGTLSVSHPTLQQALIETAAEAGAIVLRPASLGGVTWEGDQPVVSIETRQEPMTLRPRLLVGADGAHSVVRRALGGEGVTDPPHHAIGGTLLAGIDLPADSAHQAYFPGGFAMMFPQRDGISRVYYVCATDESERLRRTDQPGTLLVRLAAILPPGAMARASGTGAPLGFFPNSETIATVTHGPNAVLIGDAAGSNDPSQGHGLSLVFRDIRDLAERIAITDDWAAVPAAFAAARAHDHDVLRAHAHWVAPLSTGTGPEVDALRARVERARELDPTAGGFAGIFATGPAGLTADEAARRHFLGEDLDELAAP